tara:strand:+ start:784 stop:1449 length:666 start_codon:yes stop_codon:yes gene_type:complete
MFEVNSVENPFIQRCYDHWKFNDYGYIYRKVFVIDDFYRYPDQVRDYALSCKRTYDKSVCGALIGSRVMEDRQDMIDNLEPVFSKLCQHKEWTNVEYNDVEFQLKWDNMKFMVNHTTHEDIMQRFTDTVYCYTHHKDNLGSKWAALVYLNKPEECDGGTNFYKFIEDQPYGNNYDIKKDIMFTSEMKYNRMVLYESRHTHGAELNRRMFKQHPRLAQVFFM